MTPRQVLAILKARWVIAASLLAVTLLTGLVVTLLTPNKYTSAASVLVDVKSPDPVAGMVLPALMSASYMATQLDLLTSDRVALRVVRSLRLAESPILRQQWEDATEGQGDYESWVIGKIRRDLAIVPSRESNVITITYTGAEPNYAAALCNAFLDAYIKTTAELRMEPARQYGELFDTLGGQLRERLEKAQARLSTFQRENNLMATDERLDIENGRLAELSTQLTSLQALQAESSSRKAQITRQADQTNDVLSNAVVASLKADVSRLEGKLEEAQARYGDSHPTIVETKANISALRQRIRDEIQRVSGSVGAQNNANEQRVALVKAALEEQRAKVLKLKALRDEASVMVRDVDNLQRAYDVVQSRATQATMESQTTQTNLSIIKAATAPGEPSSPNLIFNMLIAAFVGTLLALSAAIGYELFDRRVRTLDDVIEDLHLPVVGVLLKSPDAPSALLGKRLPPWLVQRGNPDMLTQIGV